MVPFIARKLGFVDIALWQEYCALRHEDFEKEKRAEEVKRQARIDIIKKYLNNRKMLGPSGKIEDKAFLQTLAAEPVVLPVEQREARNAFTYFSLRISEENKSRYFLFPNYKLLSLYDLKLVTEEAWSSFINAAMISRQEAGEIILKELTEKLKNSRSELETANLGNTIQYVTSIINEREKYSDKTVQLISKFIKIPGIEYIILTLYLRDEQQRRGAFEELYHAELLEKEYKILAFSIEIVVGNAKALQIDILTQNKSDGDYYFVEVKHLTANKRPTDFAYDIRKTINGNGFFMNFGKFYQSVRIKGGKSLYIPRLRQMLGDPLVDDLINKFQGSPDYKLKILLSISLDLDLEKIRMNINEFMLALAVNSGIHLDCYNAGISPTIIVRQFVKTEEATDNKVVFSREVRKGL